MSGRHMRWRCGEALLQTFFLSCLLQTNFVLLQLTQQPVVPGNNEDGCVQG